jgi:hypothetical protein
LILGVAGNENDKEIFGYAVNGEHPAQHYFNGFGSRSRKDRAIQQLGTLRPDEIGIRKPPHGQRERALYLGG